MTPWASKIANGFSLAVNNFLNNHFDNQQRGGTKLVDANVYGSVNID